MEEFDSLFARGSGSSGDSSFVGGFVSSGVRLSWEVLSLPVFVFRGRFCLIRVIRLSREAPPHPGDSLFVRGFAFS